MFSSLEVSVQARRRKDLALLAGVFVQAVAIGAGILAGVMFPQELPLAKRYIMTWLPPLDPPKPPAVKPIHRPPPVIIPKLKPTPALELPPPPIAELKVPKIPPVPNPLPLPVPPPVAPPEMQPPPPPKPKEQIVVRTGLFGGAPEKVTTTRPANQVQTGGFGDPQGFKGQAKGDSLGNVPKVGLFGLPDGPGYGNGTGGKHGVPGVVASAGFGSGMAGGGPGGGGAGGNAAPVSVGGFEKSRQVAAAPAANPEALATVDFQPVEIISKPTPVYTEEARKLGIQGDVALSVIFLADGTIKLNGVVKSLGHGLDQAAEQAAMRIRFKPAKRAGQPTDFPATLRIEFRLADHS